MKRRQRENKTAMPSSAQEERMLKHHPVESLELSVTYRKQKISAYKGAVHDYILRRYFVGGVQVALMYIYEPDTMQAGNVAVHIASKPTGGGIWFQTKREAQRLIIQELSKVPDYE